MSRIRGDGKPVAVAGHLLWLILADSPAAERLLRRLRNEVRNMGRSAQLLRAEAVAGETGDVRGDEARLELPITADGFHRAHTSGG